VSGETPEPFVIQENALYSLETLRERLRGIVELPTLLERLGLRDARKFRDAVWGWEILDASRKAGTFNEAARPAAAVVDVGRRPMVKGRGRNNPVRTLGARDVRK
jgi:hypothetical protein